MKKLKQMKFWIFGPLLVIALLLSAKIIAQKNNTEDTLDKSYKLSLVSSCPVFPGCEGEDWEIRKCLSENLTEHFKNNLNSVILGKLNAKNGKKRVYVSFQIDKQGEFTSIRASTENKGVTKEIIRVFSLLPTIIPGKKRKEEVNVRYSLSVRIVDGDLEVKARPTVY